MANAADNEAKRALDSFINALPSVKSQREYKFKLKKFLDFHGLSSSNNESSLEEQVKAFIEKSRDGGTYWIQSSIISFVNHYKQRVIKDRNLAAGTLQSYLGAIKLFCDMNDDIIPGVTTINWKKINKGLPPAGISDNYWRPTEQEVLEDYKKAIHLLTINDQRSTLLLKVKEQTEKNKQEVYALKGQLAEKAKEVEDLELVKAKMDIMTANMMSLMK